MANDNADEAVRAAVPKSNEEWAFAIVTAADQEDATALVAAIRKGARERFAEEIIAKSFVITFVGNLGEPSASLPYSVLRQLAKEQPK